MAGLKSLAKDTAIYGLSSIVGRFLNYMLVPLVHSGIASFHRRLWSCFKRICVYSPDACTAYVRYGNGILPFCQQIGRRPDESICQLPCYR